MLKILWKEIQEIDTGRKAVRSFGLLVGAVLLGISLLLLWNNSWSATTAVYALAAAGSILVLGGLLVPTLLLPAYRVWMGLAVVLGFVMTRVILTIVFYLVITPTGLILRLAGKDPLNRKWEPETASYWIDKTYDDESPQRLERYY